MASIAEEEDGSDSPEAQEPEVCDDSYAVNILSIGDVLDYTVPTCSVVTLRLQHAVTSMWDSDKGETVQFDVFFKHSMDVHWGVPCSVQVLESCYVPVGIFVEFALGLGCI